MPPEVIAKVFEPFYTTKGVGKGTGLGLSMIYGFVKQSRGFIRIYSEVGEGTTVKIYLPRAAAEANASPKTRHLEVLNTMARGEVIMIVEDDAEVRIVVVTILEELGYEVLESGTGALALEQMKQSSSIDLLLTDVILPGNMGGRELADRARDLFPGLKVLFMSGYAENAIMHHGRLDRRVNLLSKPFGRAALGEKVRQILDD